jgi:hypothetical protein
MSTDCLFSPMIREDTWSERDVMIFLNFNQHADSISFIIDLANGHKVNCYKDKKETYFKVIK